MKCLCESVLCPHNEDEEGHLDGEWMPCDNESGKHRVEMLGKVCDPCANHYRELDYRVEEV